MDFDTLLTKIGDFHRYQYRIVFLLCFPFCFFLTFVYFGQIFITLEPDHWCHVPNLGNWTVSERKELAIPKEDRDGKTQFSHCQMYNIDYEKLWTKHDKGWSKDIVNVTRDFGWNITSCRDGWEYDYDNFYPTVVSEWNWVCEDNWRAPLAQSLFFVGAVVGCIIFGIVSDWFGRIPALIVTNLLACAAGIATAFSQGFVTFVIFRFFMGMTFDSCFVIYYILVLEYVGPSKRTLVSNVALGLFFCCGTVVIPWVAYGIANWRIFAIVTSAPMVTVILIWRFTPESARWLLTKGKIERATKIIEEIAKINKIELKSDVLSEFQNAANESDTNTRTSYTLIDVFRKPTLRRRVLILFFVWFLTALVYDGHARNTHNLGYDVFFSFSVASATETPAAVLIILLMDRIGRRWMFFLSLLLGGIVSLFFVLVPTEILWLGLTLALVGRLFTNVAFNVGLQYTTELLPTVVRGQGMAASHLLGFVSNIISPFVVYLAHYSHALPLVIFGCLSIVAGVSSLFLPETLNQDLPETLDDGENFGKSQPFCLFPCCTKKASKTSVVESDIVNQLNNAQDCKTRF